MKVKKVLKLMDNSKPAEGVLGIFKSTDDACGPTRDEMAKRIDKLYDKLTKDHAPKKGYITDADGKAIYELVKPKDRKA